MSNPSQPPFIRDEQSAPVALASALESLGQPGLLATPLPVSPDHAQRHRAHDLFVRGVLTEEQMREASSSTSGFEAIIGKADYLPAYFMEQGVLVTRATCLIRTSGVDYMGRPGSWSGTGFMISPNILVTNHHVLNSKEVAGSGEAIFNYQILVGGQPAQSRTFRLRPDTLFVTSPAVNGLDFTFVWVEGEPGREFGMVPLKRSAFAIAPNEYANVVSHPSGRPKVVSIKENEVKWQDDLVVHYASDTEPGSSGASVANNNWQLVALHHASRPSSVAGFPVLNEGIKFSAIAADLERRARSSGSDSAAAARVLAAFDGTDERLGFFGTAGRPQPGNGNALERVVNSYIGSEQDIDVGFWNVEWLSNRYESKAAAVAQVIHDMKLDIWCLEESSPNGMMAVVEELRQTYGLNFAFSAAEPDATDEKQSCTLLWNTDTVTGEKIAWGEPIETWLQTHSRDFEDLGLEAVHGKIFDRYPALFHFTTVAAGPGGDKLDFHVVPLHLKAKDEGSLRRRMASKILAAAVKQRIADGFDSDYIIGGDFNASLASDDFDALSEGGMVPVSAEDEGNGAITYIKSPYLSLIDHVYLSPNLATTHGTQDFFIVAAEATFPDYIRNISDHRPIVFRMRIAPEPEAAPVTGGMESTSKAGEDQRTEALEALRRQFAEAQTSSLERRRAPGRDASSAVNGYQAEFLGTSFMVPLPGLGTQTGDAVVVSAGATGIRKYVLPYTHFSVTMNGTRKLPIYSAVNIDGRQLRSISRGDNWRTDPRIPETVQAGNALYRNNDLDKGHMTRRLDPVWGDEATAARANDDTFYYTNSCPQHKDLNQKEWLELEDYVLDSARAHDLKVSVFTGPVFGPNDIVYRGVGLPEEFWKVVVIVNSETGRLSATGYILSQRDMISEFEFVYGEFKTYQVPISRIAARTGLDFGNLPSHDPMALEGLESSGLRATRLGGPGDIRL